MLNSAAKLGEHFILHEWIVGKVFAFPSMLLLVSSHRFQVNVLARDDCRSLRCVRCPHFYISILKLQNLTDSKLRITLLKATFNSTCTKITKKSADRKLRFSSQAVCRNTKKILKIIIFFGFVGKHLKAVIFHIRERSYLWLGFC